MQNTILPANSQCMGSMDQPVGGGGGVEMVVADRLALLHKVISYVVKQYCLKLEKLHT
jgi:hypothetical protein